ncbi:radical SAM protein [bacterium]|nr:radical SAM protein [bacterium]
MFAYGPVPSRRLGKSIGVSPIPAKTCSYSCIYCQLGRTDHMQVKRKSFFQKEDIFRDIEKVVNTSPADFITFAGDGEPTLCKDLGWLIENTKNVFKLPIAVITNGSLLYREDVRKDLKNADVVMPTLDVGNQALFEILNRPLKTITFEKMLQGLIDFRQDFRGQIWSEVMLVSGINDSVKELNSIKDALVRTRSDRVYITTPVRPPAENWVESPDPLNILLAEEIFEKVVSITEQETGDFGVMEFSNACEAILEISARHPLRMEQALKIERKFGESGTIKQLVSQSRLVKRSYRNTIYVMPNKIRL